MASTLQPRELLQSVQELDGSLFQDVVVRFNHIFNPHSTEITLFNMEIHLTNGDTLPANI